MSTFGASNWGADDGGNGGGARNNRGRSHERSGPSARSPSRKRRCDDDRGRPYRRSMPDFVVTSVSADDVFIGTDWTLPDVGDADYPMDRVVFGMRALARIAEEYTRMEECRAPRSKLLRQYLDGVEEAVNVFIDMRPWRASAMEFAEFCAERKYRGEIITNVRVAPLQEETIWEYVGLWWARLVRKVPVPNAFHYQQKLVEHLANFAKCRAELPRLGRDFVHQISEYCRSRDREHGEVSWLVYPALMSIV
ncbi:hypothetical protein DYB28_006774 [Aphanomyces astaci]|uniref:Uncharacterized protein n=1 Tax=Aphanomyces astaci TaxID=112090 RepID=A0A9X8H8A1_APHAT|nr:hypothetical protein DYB28_006774 [Aphanomyces astaci]